MDLVLTSAYNRRKLDDLLATIKRRIEEVDKSLYAVSRQIEVASRTLDEPARNNDYRAGMLKAVGKFSTKVKIVSNELFDYV